MPRGVPRGVSGKKWATLAAFPGRGGELIAGLAAGRARDSCPAATARAEPSPRSLRQCYKSLASRNRISQIQFEIIKKAKVIDDGRAILNPVPASFLNPVLRHRVNCSFTIYELRTVKVHLKLLHG